MWLPAGWDQSIAEQLNEAERRFGPIGVAGVYGVGEVIARRDATQPLAAQRIGWVVDRGRALRDGPDLPAQVATLDELLLIVRRDAGLRLTLFWDSISMELIFAFRQAKQGGPWWLWRTLSS